MQYIPISNEFYYRVFGCRHSMERFEGARVIVLSPNSVHEDNFITLGVYFGGEGQQLCTCIFESSDLYKSFFGMRNTLKSLKIS